MSYCRKGKATFSEDTRSDRKESFQHVTKGCMIPYGQPCTTPTAGQARYATNELHRLPNGFLVSHARPAAPANHGQFPMQSCGVKFRGRPISEHCWREKRTKKQVIYTLNAFTCHGKQVHLADECRGMNQPEDVSLSVSPFIPRFYFCM